jgi:tetratricopeptide (TPR) repeat protein
LLAPPVSVAAQASPERLRRARTYYKRGKAAFELGKFRTALGNYEEAYKVASLPGLLFNIGQCYRNLGEHEKAVFSFRLYLRKIPNAKNRDATLVLIRELEQKIKLERVRERKRRADEARRRREEDERLEEERRRLAALRGRKGTRSTPIYKRWWFWTLIGVAAAGAGAGVYFGTRSSGHDLPASPLPNWEL